MHVAIAIATQLCAIEQEKSEVVKFSLMKLKWIATTKLDQVAN